MNMIHVLTDAQWAQMQPHCLGKPTTPDAAGPTTGCSSRRFSGLSEPAPPWRDLPPCFGKWNTVLKRYRDWAKAGVFTRLFRACSDDPDLEYAIVDATIVKVHRHGQGAKGGLRARPSDAPRAVRRPRSLPLPTRSATWCASCCCLASATTPWACRRLSRGSRSVRSSGTWRLIRMPSSPRSMRVAPKPSLPNTRDGAAHRY